MFDWSEPFQAFRDKLVDLCDHLQRHDFYVGVEDDVKDMTEAIRLMDVVLEGHGWDSDKEWDALWVNISANMRKWWD